MATHSSILAWKTPWTEKPVRLQYRVSEISRLCPTLCDTIDCSPPGSSAHGIGRQSLYHLSPGVTKESDTTERLNSNRCTYTGLPGGTAVKNLPASAVDAGNGAQFLGQEDPWEEETATALVFSPVKFHRQRSLVGCSPWGRRGSDTPECTHAHTENAQEVLRRSKCCVSVSLLKLMGHSFLL